MDFVGIIGDVASVIVAITTIFGFFITLTECGKKLLGGWLIKVNEPTSKAILCVLRSNLRQMCFECLQKKYMTRGEFEDIVEAADAYTALGGNSGTHKLVDSTLALGVREDCESDGKNNCPRCNK